MHPILRNILAFIAGIVIGGVVNMGLINISGYIIPPPAGADVSTTEHLIESIHLFEPKHFIFPFLAHALGTLTGAFIAAKFAANNPMKFAIGIGVFFLIGGITAVYMIPAPMWFKILDLVVAYIPMGWLGGKLAKR